MGGRRDSELLRNEIPRTPEDDPTSYERTATINWLVDRVKD